MSRFSLPTLWLTVFCLRLLVGRALTDDLQQWLQSLRFDVPAIAFPMPVVGNVAIDRGECWGISLADIQSRDNSVGETIDVGLNLTNFGVSCRISADNGTTAIDVVLENSSLGAYVSILPYVSSQNPSLQLPMGQVNMSDCLVDLRFTRLNISGSSKIATLAGSLSESALIGILGNLLPGHLCEQMQDYMLHNVTSVFAEYGKLASLLPALRQPPLAEPKTLTPLVNWTEYPPIQIFKSLLAANAARGVEAVQYLDNFRVPTHLPIYAGEKVQVLLSAVEMTGFDQVIAGGLTVQPDNHSIGMALSPHTFTVQATLDIRVDLPGQDVFLKPLNVSVSIANGSLKLRSMISQDTLQALHTDQLQSPSCLAQCAEMATEPGNASIAVEEIYLELGRFNSVSAHGYLGGRIATFMNSTLHSIFHGYYHSLAAVLWGGSGLLRTPIDKAIWRYFDSLPSCGRNTTFEGATAPILLAILAFALGAMTLGVAIAGRRYAAATPQKSDVTANRGPGSAERSTSTLGQNPVVPLAVGTIYPFAIVAVLCLFIVAALSLGATVTMDMNADGREASVGPVFVLSLVNLIEMTWSAGAHMISVMILLFSGVWPVLKLGFLLALWLTSPQMLSAPKRDMLFAVFNSTCKYSLVETWFMVLTMSPFRLNWSWANTSLSVVTTPQSGFFMFLLATFLLLALGQIAHYYHLRATSESTVDFAESDEAPCALGSYCASQTTKACLSLLLLSSIVFTAVGVSVASLDFIMAGLGPQLLLGPEGGVMSHSLIGIAQRLQPDSVGVGLLVFIFVVATVLLPMILLTMFLGLLLLPLSRAAQNGLLQACYVLDSWAALDVFVFTVVIGHFQFDRLAKKLAYRGDVGAVCRMVHDVIGVDCFDIEIAFKPGFAALLLAGLALLIVPKVAYRICFAAMRARDETLAKAQSELQADQERGEATQVAGPVLMGRLASNSTKGTKVCSRKSDGAMQPAQDPTFQDASNSNENE